MTELIQRCNRLTKLGFHKSSGLKESHFAIIGSSTSITSLTFNHCYGNIGGDTGYFTYITPTDGCTDDTLTALGRDGRLQLKEITIGFGVEGWGDNQQGGISDDGVNTLTTRFAASLESATFALCGITDEGLAALQICSQLKSVTLKFCPYVTDDGLAALANCPHLRSIEVDYKCELVTGECLDPITERCGALEKINCRGSQVKFAVRCPLLRDITLYGATDKKVKHLVKGCPLLTHLRLYQSDKLTDVSLEAIASGLPYLEVLAIYSEDTTGMTQSGLHNLLEKCQRINFLDLGATDYERGELIEPKNKRIEPYRETINPTTGMEITDPALRQMILQRRILVAGWFNNQSLAYDPKVIKERSTYE